MDNLTSLSQGLRTFLISKGKTFFQNAPVSSNVGFSILLFIAEKIVEMDFTCPCGADCSALFVTLLFVIPGVVAFVLVAATQTFEACCQECRPSRLKKICVCICIYIFPPTVWEMLMFLDGRYYTCWKTDWTGLYVTVNHTVLEKWCEPNDRILYQERLIKSYGWYACSQSYGLLLLGALAVLTHIIIKSQPSNSEETPSTPEGDTIAEPRNPST